MAANDAHLRIARAVRRFGAYRKRWSALRGLATFVLVGPAALLAWFLIDWLIGLPMWPLALIFAAIVLTTCWSLVWHLLRPLGGRVDVEREALAIESLDGRLDNQLIGALQLGAVPDAAKAGHSAALVTALVERTAKVAESVQPSRLLDLRGTRRALAAAAAVAAAIVLCLVAAPDAVAQRVARLADAYAGILDAIFPVELRVTPGDVAVLRGSALTLSVEVIGAHRDRVELIRVDEATSEAVAETLTLSGGAASLAIDAATADFTYRFRYGRHDSTTHRVRIGDRADLSAITYELAYPAYTGMPSRTVVGRVNRLQALAATTVQISLASSNALHPELSYVEWQDGARQPLTVTGRFASFGFTVERPERATIHLCGALGRGFEIAQPVGFEVIVDRDQPPTVEALMKEAKLTMMAEEAAAFSLAWRAEDDFGVAEVALDWRIDTIDPLLNRPTRTGAVPRLIEPARDRVKDRFSDLFKDLSPALEPGDRIAITITATDNNTETGPGVGRSAPIEIVIIDRDLSKFSQQQYAFGAESALGGLKRIKRATLLLVEPDKTVRAEAPQVVERQELKSRVGQEGFPSGADEAVGAYFRLLAGEQ